MGVHSIKKATRIVKKVADVVDAVADDEEDVDFEEVKAELVATFRNFEPMDRVELFDELAEVFCLRCGEDTEEQSDHECDLDEEDDDEGDDSDPDEEFDEDDDSEP